MIPEFHFKKKSNVQKKIEIKEFLSNKKVRIASGAVVGVLAVSLTVAGFAGSGEEKSDVTALLQEKTAGVSAQIDSSEKMLQKQMKQADVSMSSLDSVRTGVTMDAGAGFNSDFVSEQAVEEEIAADEAAAIATPQAVTAEAADVSRQAAEPVSEEAVRPQLTGFSNPGISRAEDFVNIRVSAKEDASVCGRLAKNTACEILGEENGWYHVVTNGVDGYVKAEYLYTGDEAWALADQLKYAYVKVLTETLYVREQPSTESTIVAIASLDQKLNIVEIQDEWIKVQIEGKEGYLNKSYIAVEYTLPRGEAVEVEKKEEKKESSKEKTSSKKNSSSKSSSKDSSSAKPAKDCSSVVEYATQFVGNPYVYGGTSLTNGTDCSGFTMSVYAKFGVYLPHSSSAQASCGVKVSASELQPGDLIFYGSGSGINHVALYIGGGQIVHASTERTGIKISNAFYRTPVTIRRVMR